MFFFFHLPIFSLLVFSPLSILETCILGFFEEKLPARKHYCVRILGEQIEKENWKPFFFNNGQFGLTINLVATS